MDFLDVQKLADANHSASRLAASRVAELWESLDGLDPDTLRDVLDELFPRLVEEQAQLAASATLEWYEDARAAAGIKKAYSPEMPAELIDYSRTSKVVEEAVSAIAQRGRLAAVGILQRRAKQLVTSAARETGLHAAYHDPAKPRYARVPAGATTCAWCLMWAGRGFIYKSEETAQFTRSHADCDCQIVPSWSDKPIIHGYDPSEFEAMYKAARKSLYDLGLARFDSDPHMLAAQIRALFPDATNDGVKTSLIDSSKGTYLVDGKKLKLGPEGIRAKQKPWLQTGTGLFPKDWKVTDIDRAVTLAWLQPTSIEKTGKTLTLTKRVNDVTIQVEVEVGKTRGTITAARALAAALNLPASA